ncbi:hypothetical protein EDB80DRAFT_708871 [Ilyonectria destructans]|nr:hypothetical protein EDB80DRAFT_708871 [Ilyonectria destructans]
MIVAMRFDYALVAAIYSNVQTKAAATSYTNPILPRWHSNPSCTFVEEWNSTYFCITSSFLAFPGIPVYASKGLVHWPPQVRSRNVRLLRMPQSIQMKGQLDLGNLLVQSGYC